MITKLNETFSLIKDSEDKIKYYINRLKVEIPGAFFNPLVKRGFKSPFEYFTKVLNSKEIIVYNGHLSLIGFKDDLKSDYSINDIKDYLKNIINVLPFKPYDYQLKCFIDSILNVKHINLLCTGSGKSLVISLLLDFFRQHNLKCVLLVPNINLLEQFKSDIKSYNLIDLYNATSQLGGGIRGDINSQILISTWQSLIQYKDELNSKVKFDVLINDEVHKNAGQVSSEIATKLLDTKYRFGFTGTLPDDPVLLYRLIGLFGENTQYITSRELIDRGLGTPIEINSIILDYPNEIKNSIICSDTWLQKLKILKEYQPRNNLIENIGIKFIKKQKNALILFSHTEHGKSLFYDIMQRLYPEIKVTNKDITGKLSFEFQQKYKVYFLNGEDDAKTREKTRKILECSEHGSILISNYSLLSTGVNIKNLHGIVFASPLKSYTTITQSLGRGIRLHKSKSKFTVFDIVDNLGKRKNSGIFYKQYQHRISTSYNPQGFVIRENKIKI